MDIELFNFIMTHLIAVLMGLLVGQWIADWMDKNNL